MSLNYIKNLLFYFRQLSTSSIFSISYRYIQVRRYALVYLGQTGNDIGEGDETAAHWDRIVTLYGRVWDSFWDSPEDDRNSSLCLVVDLLDACRRYKASVLNGARQRWTTFGATSLGVGVIGTAVAVLFSIWVVISLPNSFPNSNPHEFVPQLQIPINPICHFPHWSQSFASWCKKFPPPPSWLSITICRFETIVVSVLSSAMFSDCFSMLESTVVRFLFTSSVLYLAVEAIGRREIRQNSSTRGSVEDQMNRSTDEKIKQIAEESSIEHSTTELHPSQSIRKRVKSNNPNISNISNDMTSKSICGQMALPLKFSEVLYKSLFSMELLR